MTHVKIHYIYRYSQLSGPGVHLSDVKWVPNIPLHDIQQADRWIYLYSEPSGPGVPLSDVEWVPTPPPPLFPPPFTISNRLPPIYIPL